MVKKITRKNKINNRKKSRKKYIRLKGGVYNKDLI